MTTPDALLEVRLTPASPMIPSNAIFISEDRSSTFSCSKGTADAHETPYCTVKFDKKCNCIDDDFHIAIQMAGSMVEEDVYFPISTVITAKTMCVEVPDATGTTAKHKMNYTAAQCFSPMKIEAAPFFRTMSLPHVCLDNASTRSLKITGLLILFFGGFMVKVAEGLVGLTIFALSALICLFLCTLSLFIRLFARCCRRDVCLCPGYKHQLLLTYADWNSGNELAQMYRVYPGSGYGCGGNKMYEIRFAEARSLANDNLLRMLIVAAMRIQYSE